MKKSYFFVVLAIVCLFVVGPALAASTTLDGSGKIEKNGVTYLVVPKALASEVEKECQYTPPMPQISGNIPWKGPKDAEDLGDYWGIPVPAELADAYKSAGKQYKFSVYLGGSKNGQQQADSQFHLPQNSPKFAEMLKARQIEDNKKDGWWYVIEP